MALATQHQVFSKRQVGPFFGGQVVVAAYVLAMFGGSIGFSAPPICGVAGSGASLLAVVTGLQVLAMLAYWAG